MVTEIEQAFHNPLNRRLEGTFLFPVPEGATLRKFTMEIDGKVPRNRLPMQVKVAYGVEQACQFFDTIANGPYQDEEVVAKDGYFPMPAELCAEVAAEL